MAIINNELNDWSDSLGPKAWADAPAEYRRRYDRNGTRQEVFAFIVETHAPQRIKELWHWLQTATPEELLAGRSV